jgi:hypothetical protein
MVFSTQRYPLKLKGTISIPFVKYYLFWYSFRPRLNRDCQAILVIYASMLTISLLEI